MKVGLWSEHKLEILDEYLRAYTTALKKQQFTTHYVDAFAGPGMALAQGEQGREIPGSPLRALETNPPFDLYWFIERDRAVFEKLEQAVAPFQSRRCVKLVHADANDALIEQVVPQIDRDAYARGVVFLDPYGLQTAWQTAEAIAVTRRLEVIVNFPVMGVHRARLPRRGAAQDESDRARLNRVFGTDDWHRVVYQAQQTLFGIDHVKVEESTRRLVEFYAQRLRSVFTCVTTPSDVFGKAGGG